MIPVRYFTGSLVKRQGSPVDIANPFRGLDWDDSLFGEDEPEAIGPLYMVATGLALRAGGQ